MASTPIGAASVSGAGDLGLIDRAWIGELRTALGGRRVAEMLRLLARELRKGPRQLRDALVARQYDMAARYAHTLKGASASAGARLVSEAAEAFERGAYADREQAVRRIERACDDTLHEILRFAADEGLEAPMEVGVPGPVVQA